VPQHHGLEKNEVTKDAVTNSGTTVAGGLDKVAAREVVEENDRQDVCASIKAPAQIDELERMNSLGLTICIAAATVLVILYLRRKLCKHADQKKRLAQMVGEGSAGEPKSFSDALDQCPEMNIGWQIRARPVTEADKVAIPLSDLPDFLKH